IAAEVDVLPLGIGAHRARAPQTVTAPLQQPEAVDAERLQDVLLPLRDQRLKPDRSVGHFVCRRLEDSALDVVPRVDAGYEAARRNVQLRARERIENGDPGVVERAVRRIELTAEGANAVVVGAAR